LFNLYSRVFKKKAKKTLFLNQKNTLKKKLSRKREKKTNETNQKKVFSARSTNFLVEFKKHPFPTAR